MDVRAIVQTLNKMFPGSKLNDAVSQAQQWVQGVPNSLSGAVETAKNIGVSRRAIEDIYSRYGKSYQARMICKLLGTTPEAIKADAEQIMGGSQRQNPSQGFKPSNNQKFPRLK